jgi:hypothetical protein
LPARRDSFLGPERGSPGDREDGEFRELPIFGAAGIADNAELTRMLLAAGADPNETYQDGSIGEALYHAVEFPAFAGEPASNGGCGSYSIASWIALAMSSPARNRQVRSQGPWRVYPLVTESLRSCNTERSSS